ncbi:hypothetical protein IHE45_19G020800 [Dioscorea alata]|uniref:Uncharacterized protein n=1 Tax=Dioscorea alata TaxID=55571 RepID=A0ACB7TWR1_DIOAL|nr:hypothetical protein IHE45_19G020800 [Dioscorea alata]
MRPLSFWCIFLLAAVAAVVLLSLNTIYTGDSAFTDHGLGSAISEQYISLKKINRKLKERDYEIETTKTKRILISFDLDDYPRIDPVPSSKATIKNGPIEHGTPVMPYIPQPTPPSHPTPRHG